MTTPTAATRMSTPSEEIAEPPKPWSTRKIVVLLALGWAAGGVAALALMNAPVSVLVNTMTGIR